MNEAQKIDYAYHADRLLLFIARRGKLPPDSDQIPALDTELLSIEDLVSSYFGSLDRAEPPQHFEYSRHR